MKVYKTELSVKNKNLLVESVEGWCDKMEAAWSTGATFDTFTQHYYDKYCELLGREKKR